MYYKCSYGLIDSSNYTDAIYAIPVRFIFNTDTNTCELMKLVDFEKMLPSLKCEEPEFEKRFGVDVYLKYKLLGINSTPVVRWSIKSGIARIDIVAGILLGEFNSVHLYFTIDNIVLGAGEVLDVNVIVDGCNMGLKSGKKYPFVVPYEYMKNFLDNPSIIYDLLSNSNTIVQILYNKESILYKSRIKIYRKNTKYERLM